jgi:hypothetical protein
MKLRHAKWSFLVSWIITVALTLSPVMAQTVTDQGPSSVTPQPNDAAETTKDIGTPVGDSFVLPELPLDKTATAFPTVSRNSTLPGALPAFPTPSSNEAPGQSKWIVTAVIVGAAVITAIILLLHGWGGGDDKPHPPNGTIIAAGPPSVSAPTH